MTEALDVLGILVGVWVRELGRMAATGNLPGITVWLMAGGVVAYLGQALARGAWVLLVAAGRALAVGATARGRSPVRDRGPTGFPRRGRIIRQSSVSVEDHRARSSARPPPMPRRPGSFAGCPPHASPPARSR